MSIGSLFAAMEGILPKRAGESLAASPASHHIVQDADPVRRLLPVQPCCRAAYRLIAAFCC